MHPENPSEVGRKIKTHYAGNELGWTTASTSTLIEVLLLIFNYIFLFSLLKRQFPRFGDKRNGALNPEGQSRD